MKLYVGFEKARFKKESMSHKAPHTFPPLPSFIFFITYRFVFAICNYEISVHQCFNGDFSISYGSKLQSHVEIM